MFSPAERLAYDRIAEVSMAEENRVQSEFDDPDQAQIDLAKELVQNLIFDSGNGQEFGGLWLNRNAADKNGAELLVVANGFITDTTQTDAKLRAYWLARSMPDKQVLIIDQPSHGLSSKYTREQRRGMMHGQLGPIGENQYAALQNFAALNLPPITSATMKAESLGSRQGLEVIKASLTGPFALRDMVALELPGTEDGRRIGIHTSFFAYEWLRSSFYNTTWLEGYKQRFVNFLSDAAGGIKEPAPGFFKRDPRMAAENFYSSALGHGTGNHVLRELIDNDVRILRILGESSQIDRYATAENEQQAIYKDHGRTFGLWVMRGESHDGTGTLSRARITAELVKYGLENIQAAVSVPAPIEFRMGDVQAGRMPYIDGQRFGSLFR
jgi:hypothetical protein